MAKKTFRHVSMKCSIGVKQRNAMNLVGDSSEMLLNS